MMRLFVVGAGGFIGSVCRYLLSGVAQQISGTSAFPVGTLTVNIIGCAVIGFLAYVADAHSGLSAVQRLFFVVGVLGGFTTFSAFANESMTLLQDGEHWYTFLNIAGHLVLCLGAVWLGRFAAYTLWR